MFRGKIDNTNNKKILEMLHMMILKATVKIYLLKEKIIKYFII
jgi:hypothetical protein